MAGGAPADTPSEALEGFKAYLPLLLSAPFLIDFILGLVIGFKAA